MPLFRYADARPWAKAIKAAVASRTMPPWFADPNYGHFANDRRLSEAEIGTLVAWANQGSLEGNPKDAPRPIEFSSGWNIRPDYIVELPKPASLPASGAINYKFVLVKGNFQEDKWIKASEMRAGNPKALHHGKVWVRPPGSRWMEKAVPGEIYDDELDRGVIGRGRQGEGNDILGKFNPGLGAQRFDIDGAAKFVPKGSDLVFELHYTPTGQPASDVSRLGLEFAAAAPASRYYLSMGPANYYLVIPPGESNAEIVSEATIEMAAKLVYVQPHMHLRGKDYELRLAYPDGRTETVFKAKYDFAWQYGYAFASPIPLPKGTRMIGIAHFDNSPNNKFNPDPSKEIRWGGQNSDEMSNLFTGLIFSVKTPAETVLRQTGPGVLPMLRWLWAGL